MRKEEFFSPAFFSSAPPSGHFFRFSPVSRSLSPSSPFLPLLLLLLLLFRSPPSPPSRRGLGTFTVPPRRRARAVSRSPSPSPAAAAAAGEEPAAEAAAAEAPLADAADATVADAANANAHDNNNSSQEPPAARRRRTSGGSAQPMHRDNEQLDGAAEPMEGERAFFFVSSLFFLMPWNKFVSSPPPLLERSAASLSLDCGVCRST